MFFIMFRKVLSIVVKKRWIETIKIQVHNDKHPLNHGVHHCSFYACSLWSFFSLPFFIKLRRNKSIHSLLSKMKFFFSSSFSRKNHLITHAKRQLFFCNFAFFLILFGLCSRITHFTVREGLFVVSGCVVGVWHAMQQIHLNCSSTKLYSKRVKKLWCRMSGNRVSS